MGNFKKTTNISGKWKFLTAAEGRFIDTETGEEIPVAEIIEQNMGATPFDLTVNSKSEDDLD